MRIPTSTYRLQITADFDLFEAAGQLPYLHQLGVDWVYLSPLLAAEHDSSHGYDVLVHDRIDPTRGGEAGLAALSAEARRLGMGVLVDIVPNHVGIAAPEPGTWWWDLLQHGPASAHARAFDVDWDASDGRVVIPVVGDDDVRDDGAIDHLELVDGELRYHDHRFPIAPETAEPGDDADVVHSRQHYRLALWREADSGLNYRRFFAVNTLAAIRVEDPEVFDASHVEIRRWFDEGLVDGLRVDHPDGLRDPGGYLADLAKLTGDAYVLVEKILEPGEALPTTWPTAGTTGYDALAHLDRVLVDPAGQTALDALEARHRGGNLDWAERIHDTKRTVADTILNSEVRRITREVIATGEVLGGPGPIEDAVAELLACFPVYRSYLPQGRAHLDEAFSLARRHRPDLADAFDLLLPVLSDPEAEPAKRFQQTSGMVMAKGVEDCAFYRYSRLTSLNEVGGDPSIFAITPTEFHEQMATRQREWPHAMTTQSTHDTKRGEDVRARISVLAELPDVWQEALDELVWLAPFPDPGFASLLWQAIVGCWPADRDRLHGYAEKAMREAGEQTTWTAPDAGFEAQVHAAVDAAYDDPRVQRVLHTLAARLAGPGWNNALSAKLVALTMPGVPDVYQGSELWEQSLVDPDNRRPVDFDHRAEVLASGPSTDLVPTIDDPGHAKLLVTRAALHLRRDHAELFTTYEPLTAQGPAAGHLLAFDRGGAITLATRLPVGLAALGGWGETTIELPVGAWRDAISGRSVSGPTVVVADLLADLPVALLTREDS